MNLEIISILLSICASLFTILAFFTGRSARKNPKEIGIQGDKNSIGIIHNKVNTIDKFYYRTVNLVFAPSQKQVNNISKNLSKEDENIFIFIFFLIIVLLGTIMQKYTNISISLILLFFVYRYIRFNRAIVLYIRAGNNKKLDGNKFIGIQFVQAIQLIVICSLAFIPLPNEFLNVVKYVEFDLSKLQSGLTTFFGWFLDVIKYLFIREGINGMYFFSRSLGLIILMMSIAKSTKIDSLPIMEEGEGDIRNSLKAFSLPAFIVFISVATLYPWYSHEIFLVIQEPIGDWVKN
ncbi:hypothetical protein J32TS2_39840 [Shouchella clausii]|uniref:hypothetical protein n=1 Tax=Shouchella clausii TaxID=79880 RepID=UPI001B0A528C|nr:hypothetical protein [Shouchella clausii]GIN18628.1 hypothetical protein J32TS2_39840 [Shouchella clausii]